MALKTASKRAKCDCEVIVLKLVSSLLAFEYGSKGPNERQRKPIKCSGIAP